MKTWILIIGIFILMVGGFGNVVISDHLRDSAIQKNPGTITAKITSHDEYTKVKYGHRTIHYTIKYAFRVEGKEYLGKVSMVNDYGARALSAGTLEVVYSKSNPKIHTLKSHYKERTLAGLIWSLAKLMLFALVLAPLAGFILAFKFGWLKKPEATAESA